MVTFYNNYFIYNMCVYDTYIHFLNIFCKDITDYRSFEDSQDTFGEVKDK